MSELPAKVLLHEVGARDGLQNEAEPIPTADKIRFLDALSACGHTEIEVSSFVSPKGLIMTNHHCARGNIATVQGKNDWVKNGFYAASYEDEVKIPGLTVQQVVEIKDVTDQVNAGVAEGDDSATISRRQQANIRRITTGSGIPTKELYSLFPRAPAKTVARLAGVHKPVGCI